MPAVEFRLNDRGGRPRPEGIVRLALNVIEMKGDVEMQGLVRCTPDPSFKIISAMDIFHLSPSAVRIL